MTQNDLDSVQEQKTLSAPQEIIFLNIILQILYLKEIQIKLIRFCKIFV